MPLNNNRYIIFFLICVTVIPSLFTLSWVFVWLISIVYIMTAIAPTYIILIFSFLVLAVIAYYLQKKKSNTLIICSVVSVALLGLVLYFELFVSGMKIEKRMMLWSLDEPLPDYPNDPAIRLRFKSDPNSYMIILSKKLKRYLESKNNPEVELEMMVFYKSGSPYSETITRIGELQQWDSKHSIRGYKYK